MATDNWIVNNLAGEEWGLIKRLIFDAATNQINYADVVVINSGHVARLPWDSFEIRNEGITLGMPEAQVTATGMTGTETAVGDISMDVWP